MKPTKETIARTIVLVIALVNQVLAFAGKGHIEIAENDVYQLVSIIATICATIVAWWKNNSFTIPAIMADEYMHNLKSGIETGEEK